MLSIVAAVTLLSSFPKKLTQEVGFLYPENMTSQDAGCQTTLYIGHADGSRRRVQMTDEGRPSLMSVHLPAYVTLEGDDWGDHIDARRLTPIGRERIVGPHADPVIQRQLPRDAFRKVADASSVESGARTPTVPNHKYLNLCLSFSDSGSTDPHPMSWYTKMFNDTYPGLDHYYRDSSFNQITMKNAQTIGWLKLPGNQATYKTNTQWDVSKLIAGALPLIQNQVDFTTIWAINVFPHEDDHYGLSYATWYAINTAKVNWYRPVTMEDTWADQAVIVHEDGHNLGFDHTSIPGAVYASEWSTMGSGGRTQQNEYDDYGSLACNHIAYHKHELGWISQSEVASVIAGQTKTVRLERDDVPTKSGYLMARAYLPGRGSKYYSVEARRYAGYDTKTSVPGEAVIIHYVDYAQAWTPGAARLVDHDPSDTSGGAGAMWRPIAGEQTFTDSANGVTIKVDSEDATGFTVTLTVQSNALQSGIVSNSTDADAGSLREAMVFANDNPGTKIGFNLPIADAAYANGVFTLSPQSALPTITASDTTLDGRTQQKATGSTNGTQPVIFIDATAEKSHGLIVNADNCSMFNIAVSNAEYSGIWVDGLVPSGDTGTPTSSAFAIYGCQMGLTADGTKMATNGWDGLSFVNGASNGIVGGTATSDRNVFSGNGSGVSFNDPNTKGFQVVDNWFGPSGNGKICVGNPRGNGIRVDNGSNNVLIKGNVICGSSSDAVLVVDSGSSNVTIVSNQMGLMPDGVTVAGNFSGAAVWNGATNVTIGGTSRSLGNIMVGNDDGVRLDTTFGNTVENNYLGCTATTATGTGNKYVGLRIFDGSHDNTIESNIISGNLANGIEIDGPGSSGSTPAPKNNLIKSNFIGTNPSGVSAWPNAWAGIQMGGGLTNNRFDSNLISGNLGGALGITDAGTNLNLFVNNLMGCNAAANKPLANGGTNVWLGNGASNNTFQGNTVVASPWDGFYVTSTSTVGNLFYGNRVGTGAVNMSNRFAFWFDGTGANTCGGVSTGQANQILGNRSFGIYVTGATEGLTMRGNVISGNGGIGINLVGNDLGNGVTLNHGNNQASGPNNLTNYPVIVATGEGDSLRTVIQLLAMPSETYLVDIYGVDQPDPSGHGQADVYLQTVTLKTDATGNATSTIATGATGSFTQLSATATEVKTGNTSEFCLDTVGSPIPRLSVNAPAGSAGSSVALQATLNDRLTGKPIGGQTLSFYVNGKLVGSASTGNDGMASEPYLIPTSMAKGTYDYRVAFGGDYAYGNTIAIGTLIVQ